MTRLPLESANFFLQNSVINQICDGSKFWFYGCQFVSSSPEDQANGSFFQEYEASGANN